MLAVAAERPFARTSPAGGLADLVPEEPDRGWPLLATPVPAGFPSPADDFVERRLSLDDHLIRNPESTFLLRVAGDALAADGIHDGDLVVIDRALPPTAGSVVVAVVAGEFALRRLGRDAGGRLRLEAATPPAVEASRSDAEDFALWGVARWVVHRLWPGRDRAA
jgi:DNA polymerase V